MSPTPDSILAGPRQTVAKLQRELAEALRKLDERTIERDEAQARETATAEVLQVINASPGDLAPVFDAMLEKAMQLCEGAFGGLWTFDVDRYVSTALRGVPTAFAEFLAETTVIPGPGSAPYRFLRGERSVIQNVDLADEEIYRAGDPQRRALVDLGGARTALQVPLRRDDAVLGVITIYRKEVRPFTDKQIALLQNFADQAVVAMENARLLDELRTRTDDLTESLEYQTATSDVLEVISRSTFDLQPVLDTLVATAARLCNSHSSALTIREGDVFRYVATHSAAPELEAFLRQRTFTAGRGTTTGRVALEGKVVHIHDVTTDPEYDLPEITTMGNIRTTLSVPLLRNGTVIGTLNLAHERVEPFTDRQIELVRTFADQAVIAMENARLMMETREALEQQTATAEVLQVINASPGDLAPVFDAMLEKATSLCEATFGILWERDGEEFHVAAARGVPPAYVEHARQPLRPRPENPLGRMLRGERLIVSDDVAAEEIYRAGDPARRALVDLTGAHSAVQVALVRDDALLGSLTVFRQEVRPFTEKQIALLQNFAAQAVVAMENARLMVETREALEQQTATAEILQVINSSPGDLTPVFDAMIEKAMRLCEAAFGQLDTYDGKVFHTRAVRGVPAAFAEFRSQNPPDYGPGTGPARMLAGERVLHHLDVMDEEIYRSGEPNRRALVDLGGARSVLQVALVKDQAFLGFMTLFRREVRPFTDSQIALLQNFAAQAVIAMENARLITETREALDRQTATAEVLQVINASPGELAPVFETMLERAVRLSEAAFGIMNVHDGERFRAVALHGVPHGFRELWTSAPPLPGPRNALSRMLSGEDVVHIEDLASYESYLTGDPRTRLLADVGGARSLLAVTLRKDGALLGSLTVYRQEVRPFSDKQIALLQSFAAQAVIAMENARLLGELQERTGDLQESLEYQTATSEVLKVISRSTFDLDPVLENVVETAIRLCRAHMGSIFRLDRGAYRWAVGIGLDPAYREIEMRTPIAPGGGTIVGRAALEGRPVQIADAMADPLYPVKEEARLTNARTMLGVPLLREGVPIGVIAMARDRVEPFSDKEVELVRTFADQAVIAIENVRLLTETREARDGAEHALRDLKSAQANLIQAEKMASLGQLTAGIAHEIKNPLNFVNNFAGLSVELLDELKETAGPALAVLDENQRAELDETIAMLSGNLAKIGEHGRRADNIVKSMLEHSRGVSGERREVDVNALIDEALNLAYHGARAQDQGFNITLERDYAATLPQIELAPQEVTRVFLNLFGNGFYAANKRARDNADRSFRPVLAVATRDLGEAVEVKVRDNGTGIPPEVRDKLFQPFFTTKPTGEGTGLGLSISYDIITQQHGGTITVESEPGSFTEFTVRLPRH